ncbi:hypothetical protein ARMGADRAFT_1082693 [Armillaria gallica]|uniref:Uncharacterized protein n=1 Tax=Armillaria gallica TaxID=47427 RepID=A0A2H3D594_ARMGA|nr:hypothetical protein ARMGADRAFT_1082693 [Armillaria gallica]
MNMNSHHIEDDEMSISKEIYALTDTIGAARVVEILHSMIGNSVEDLDVRYIGRTLQNNYATTGYIPLEATPPPRNVHSTAPTRGTIREMPPSDPTAFDAWIVGLFLRNVDTSYQHPEWLYARKQAPRHISPTDPAAFDAWIVSFITRNKANKTHHRDAVRDEPHNSTFVDTLSGGPSGLATVMAGQSYPQHGLPWWIVPPWIHLLLRVPSPVVATTVPRWLSNGEPSFMFMSHAHVS